jgi:peptidylprolyl isomerase
MRRSAYVVVCLTFLCGMQHGVSAGQPPKTEPPKSAEAKRHHRDKKPEGEKVVTTSSGLQYCELKVGKGMKPRKGQRVVVLYIGKLANGAIFDATSTHTDAQHPNGQPYEFQIGMGDVIPGWDEGVLNMKVGGKRRLIVPPKLGYGELGRGPIPPNTIPIPPNATLICEIELLGVK